MEIAGANEPGTVEQAVSEGAKSQSPPVDRPPTALAAPEAVPAQRGRPSEPHLRTLSVKGAVIAL